MRARSRSLKLGALSVAAVLALAACASDGSDASQTGKTTTTAAAPAGSIVEVATADGDLSTLAQAIEAAGLVDALSAKGPFTVFAPGNAAFGALPKGALADLLTPDKKDELAAILKYHVVEGRVQAADLTDGRTLTTLGGEELTVGVDGGTVTLTDATGLNLDQQYMDILLPRSGLRFARLPASLYANATNQGLCAQSLLYHANDTAPRDGKSSIELKMDTFATLFPHSNE